MDVHGASKVMRGIAKFQSTSDCVFYSCLKGLQ